MKRILPGVVILLFLICFCGCSRREGKPIDLVREGKPCAKIVVADDACRMTQYAAEELQKYVEKASGATLPIEKIASSAPAALNENESYIFVGRSPYTDRLGIKISKLKRDGFRIIARDNWLAVVGRDYKGEPLTASLDRVFSLNETYDKDTGISAYGQAGTLYGVYRFLENYLGVRWFMPGDLGEVVPEMRTISIPWTDYSQAPDFTTRRLYFAYGFEEDQYKDMVRWYRRAGFGGVSPMPFVHSFRYFADRHFKEHPEYFLDNGKAKYKFLALKDPAVLKQFVEDIRDYFNIHTNEFFYPVMPDDMNLDADPEAQKRDERFHGIADESMGIEGRFSDYVWGFVNEVAKEIGKTHPGKLIGCCAYADYKLPPRRLGRLELNVAVMITDTRCQNANAKNKEKIRALVNEWRAKTKRIFFWEYYNWYYCGGVLPGTPVIFPHIIAEDLRSLKGISAGEFIEAETTGIPNAIANNGMTHLNYYVTARYYWDAAQDIEKLLSDYYEKFYGPAQEEMRKFFTRSEELWRKAYENPPMTKYGYCDPGSFVCKPEEVKELLGYLEAARAKGGESVYGARVELILSEARQMIKKSIETSLECVPLPAPSGREEGLLAYWKFDETEGRIVRDSSGNGNDGVIHGARRVKCATGSSLEFNGTNSAVEIRYPRNLCQSNRAVTISGWFYFPLEKQNAEKLGLVWGPAYFLWLNNGFVTFAVYAEKGGTYVAKFSMLHLITPGWNHIAAVYNLNDQNKERLKLYLNGEKKTTSPFADKMRDASGERFFIGASYFKTEYQGIFKGKIDELKIYGRALSDQEIEQEYENGKNALISSH